MSSDHPGSAAKGRAKLIWALVILLAILHWDFWLWSDGRLLFDFLPIGLAYQAAFSLAAAALWTAAVWMIWPSEVEEWASTPSSSEGESES